MNGGEDERGGPSPIAFRLEPGSGVPTYLQLVQQVEQALRLGYLEPGDQLPRVKDVVGSLAINPNTVLKAYRELEHRGLAGGRPGKGTFVEGTLGRVGVAQQAELRRGLAGWMRAAAGEGLDADGMAALFTAALRDFTDGAGGQPGHPSQRPGRAGPRGRPGHTAPGHTGQAGHTTPGHSGHTAPGHSGHTAPGHSGHTAPGQAEGVA
jgi:GntR family transcriptional regulator